MFESPKYASESGGGFFFTIYQTRKVQFLPKTDLVAINSESIHEGKRKLG